MIKNPKEFYFYQPAAVLKVTGEDAFTFLQGQFTNELRRPLSSEVYGLWLNQKGKVLADSHVLRIAENEFIAISLAATAAVIGQRLEHYIIADDVVVSDQTEKSYGLALWGEECAAGLKVVLGDLPRMGHFLAKDDLLIFPGRRTTGENYEIIGFGNGGTELRERLRGHGFIEVSADDAEIARISAGVPSIPADIGPADLPNEAGLETTAISYTKGCYLGQEVMARLKNLGQVRRQLRTVKGLGAAPKNGSPLFQAAKKVGEIRSAIATEHGFIAFAMLSRMGLDESAGFSFEPTELSGQKSTVWMS